MLADYTLSIEPPADAYRFKQRIYEVLDAAGVSVNPRGFLYTQCPLDGSVIVRTDSTALSSLIAGGVRPVLKPIVDRQYDFCLRATPMREVGRRHLPDDPRGWMIRQADKLGIEVIEFQFRAGHRWCSKPTKDAIPGFYIPDVVYLGRLIVRDASKLLTALASGVGRHRAFGFGLLQLFEE